MAEKEYVVCPFCFLNRLLRRPNKKISSFDNFDLDNNIFVQIRDIRGGRGTGGWFVDEAKSLTIPKALKIPEYNALLKQIYIQAKKFIKLVEKQK